MRLPKNLLRVKTGENVIWETHKVNLSRVPGFGFGIAVSGGRDNPHFANGDPSIAISDVLKAGPAEGKLLINDRVLKVNGKSLENVNHATAISILKDCGQTVNLVVRRRVVLQSSQDLETPPLKVTLNKKNRKDEFGVVLGCRFFIKEIIGNSLAAQEGCLKEGDTVLKINTALLENLSLPEAKKLIEKAKDKLLLTITKKKLEDINHKRQNSAPRDDEFSLGYGTLKRSPHDPDDVNIYRPSLPNSPTDYRPPVSLTNEDLYRSANTQQIDLPPGGTYSSLGRNPAQYDVRYDYDGDVPPRPPLPSGLDTAVPARSPSPRNRDPPQPDPIYSPQRKDADPYYRQDNDRLRPDSQHEDFRNGPYNRYPDAPDVGMVRKHHEELDQRTVQFRKEPDVGLGLQLAGGNSTGIFVGSVQMGSNAETEGLVEGDQLLRANNVEITGMTREEAVSYLASLEGEVSIVVQYRKEEYDRIMASHEAGDSFHIKTHFGHEQPEAGEMGFGVGDVFHVKDTLYRGIVGSWMAVKLDKNNQEMQRGIIPNKNRAERLSLSHKEGSLEKENSPTKTKGGIFKRKTSRRSKSLGKDHWEEVIFASLETKFPIYERVLFQNSDIVRPVVIFGALADIARERLLREYPKMFECPQADSDAKRNKTGIIRLGAIREIIKNRKHCLLDVTPQNVDRLNYAQYWPIVINLKSDNKNTVKDARAKWAKGSTKTPKKHYEQSCKIEKLYSHLFTGTVQQTTSDEWLMNLRQVIEEQQRIKIWMSERKPEDDNNDEYMFPMNSRLSLVGTSDQDADYNRARTDMDLISPTKRHMVRSSSDPSLATAEHIPGIPPYPFPPSYYHGNKDLSPDSRNFHPARRDDYRGENEQYPGSAEDRYYPSYYADQKEPHPRSSIDPYATLTPSERLRGRLPSDGYWQDPRYQENRGAGRGRMNSDSYLQDAKHYDRSPTGPPYASQPNLPPFDQKQQNDSSSHSSDSFNKYIQNPANKHDDTKLREKFGSMTIPGSRGDKNDPYRFTRSTTQPANTTNVDKAKLSEMSAKYRSIDNTSRNKLVPPQKPPHSHNSSPSRSDLPTKVKKEPPPVPVKTYSLQERGVVFQHDEQKVRNYENSNRNYNINESPYGPAGRRQPDSFRNIPPDQKYYNNQKAQSPHANIQPPPPHGGNVEAPYEYIAFVPKRQSETNSAQYNGYPVPYSGDNVARQQHPTPHQNDGHHGSSYQSPSNQYYKDAPYSDNRNRDAPNTRSFQNQIYMDSRDVDRLRNEAQQRMYPGHDYRQDYSSPTDRPSELPHQSNYNSDQSGSAFEAYRKPASPANRIEQNGFPSPTQQAPFIEKTPSLAVTNSDKVPTPTITVNDLNSSENQTMIPKKEVNDNPTQPNIPNGADTSGSSSTPDTVVNGYGGAELDSNHTVVDTKRGTFNHEGGVLESKDTGVSIVIPRGAIPDGIQQEIYFRVCKDNNILPPLDEQKGEKLLSPLVMCGPHGLTFQKPVELRLPHTASLNPEESWSFALKSSDTPSGNPNQWQNVSLAGMEGVAQGHVGKSSVSVLVDHF